MATPPAPAGRVRARPAHLEAYDRMAISAKSSNCPRKFWTQSTAASVSMSVNFTLEPVDNRAPAQIAWMRWPQSYWGTHTCERICPQYAYDSTPLLLRLLSFPLLRSHVKRPQYIFKSPRLHPTFETFDCRLQYWLNSNDWTHLSEPVDELCSWSTTSDHRSSSLKWFIETK